ncbi:unnamed protein product [Notodromas monacha]|uniref:Uncharacterized protein n=1 Tax=Notodromas monacha TaxID=399045 RepID=A0A7R9BTL7_9CRUS|nr:unnamed protein product [Notodromas monacha]CAG0920480.1 unnamed protein product [Notodromas monacha]
MMNENIIRWKPPLLCLNEVTNIVCILPLALSVRYSQSMGKMAGGKSDCFLHHSLIVPCLRHGLCCFTILDRESVSADFAAHLHGLVAEVQRKSQRKDDFRWGLL